MTTTTTTACTPACSYEYRGGGTWMVCAAHGTRHVCGETTCDRRVLGANGLDKCSLTGRVFYRGDCMEHASANAPPPPAAGSSGGTRKRGGGAGAGAGAGGEAKRSKKLTDAARAGIANVVRAAVPLNSLARERGDPAQHQQAYIAEIERLWIELGTHCMVKATVHAIGVLMIMHEGMAPYAAEPDALLQRTMLTPAHFDSSESTLLRTRDGMAGRNRVIEAMRAAGVRARKHEDALRELSASASAAPHTSAVGGGGSASSSASAVSLSRDPSENFDRFIKPYSPKPCRELTRPPRVADACRVRR